MKKPALSLALAVILCAGLVLPQLALAKAPVPVTGRVVIGFRPGMTPVVTMSKAGLQTGVGGLDGVLQRHGAAALAPLFGAQPGKALDAASRADFARYYLLEHGDASGNDAVIAELLRLPEVETAESDLAVEVDGTAYLPNDLTSQWHLRNMSMGGGDTRAIGGWSQTLGDSNVVVAVLDSGVDWLHPDLGGPHPDKVNGAIATNWEEYYGTFGVDDDANGFIDDIRGWDFVNVPVSNVYPGEDAELTDNDPMDFGGHGTMVSGCIAPLTGNGIGVAAIAPGCKILPVRVGALDASGVGVNYMAALATGIMYARNNGAKVINISSGTGYITALGSAVTSALNAGLIICVAAGNDNDEVAGYVQGLSDDRILAVAATGAGDARTSFSSYGTWVDISAPGEGIYTTSFDHVTSAHGYTSTQGTSFSSPITAGACALLWSGHPGWTSTQVAAIIQSSADNIDALNPAYAGKLGFGRVNLLRALGDNVQQFPQEFPTLFDAMNCAAAGDTVKILGSTTLTGPFTVFGKGLKVFGGYNPGYTTRNLASGRTTVLGNGGVALTFAGTITQTTEVDGFDVSGGSGQNMSIIAPGTRCAGGVLLNQVSPILRNLKVHGNNVGSAAQLGCGGGVLMTGSSATLQDCEISGNGGTYGAGVFILGGAPTLTGCTIKDNVPVTTTAGYLAKGGGIYAADTNVNLANCTVSGHAGLELGGGAWIGGQASTSTATVTGGTFSGNTAKTGGGGLYHTGGTLSVNGTTFADNGKTAASMFMYGGGLQVTGGATATLTGLTCRGNQAQVGGGVAVTSCAASTVSNSVFHGNLGQYWAGGLLVDLSPGSSVTGNTATANTGGNGGGGIHVSNGAATISRNISAFNLGGSGFGNGVALVSSTATATCNDVFGNQNAGWTGMTDPTGTGGNIAADPLFCDAATNNFQLQGASPCRPGNSGSCGQIGALLGACYVSPVPGEVPGVAFRVEQNFPNPFNPKTTIRFVLPTAAHETVAIYDIAGHHVKTLVNDDLEAATHDVTWTGDDAHGRPVGAGVYFYEVNGGGNRAVGRMALVK